MIFSWFWWLQFSCTRDIIHLQLRLPHIQLQSWEPPSGFLSLRKVGTCGMLSTSCVLLGSWFWRMICLPWLISSTSQCVPWTCGIKDCIQYVVQHTHQLSEIAFDLGLGEVEVGVALVWSGAVSLRYWLPELPKVVLLNWAWGVLSSSFELYSIVYEVDAAIWLIWLFLHLDGLCLWCRAVGRSFCFKFIFPWSFFMCLGVPSDLYLGICIQQGGGSVELEPCLIRTPSVAPTLAPAASERTVTTRAASSVIVWFALLFCEDTLGMSLIYVHQLTS